MPGAGSCGDQPLTAAWCAWYVRLAQAGPKLSSDLLDPLAWWLAADTPGDELLVIGDMLAESALEAMLEGLLHIAAGLSATAELVRDEGCRRSARAG